MGFRVYLKAMALRAAIRTFATALELEPLEWAGLRSWRMAAPPEERRRWGRSGPELPLVAAQEKAVVSGPEPHSLAEWGALVLATPEPLLKAAITHRAYQLWSAGAIPIGVANALDAPARPDKPELVHPRKVPSAKDLSISHSVHMIHNLAHIELNAIDLAWDTVVRFSASSHELDMQFFSDFAHVADDESRHLCWCLQRLEELGSCYGDMPAHNLLWKDCQKTSGSVDARLAVIPMVQEARGLDAGPRLIEKLKCLGDNRTGGIVKQISGEELAHVAVGVSWFLNVCKKLQCDPAVRFRELMVSCEVELKGPFNHSARAAAGLPQSWYDTSRPGKKDPIAPKDSDSSSHPHAPRQQVNEVTSSSCLPEVCRRLAHVVSAESERVDELESSRA